MSVRVVMDGSGETEAEPLEKAPVAVIAEETIELTNAPTHFKWAGHGLKLHIPAGSLPRHSKCSVCLQAYLVADQRSFLLPEGSELVSALYSISATGRLGKEISLEIEHCLGSPSDRAKAICVIEDCSIGPPYTFKYSEHHYDIRDSHCRVSLKLPPSLCWVAVTGQAGCAPKLSALLYLQCETLTRQFLYFVLIRNLEISMKMVETEYLSKPSARKLLHLPRVVLANQSKAITLDIPRKGVVTDSGWRISPTEYPAKLTVGPSGVKVQQCLLVEHGDEKEEGRSVLPYEYTMKVTGTDAPRSFLVYYNGRMTSEDTLAATSPTLDASPFLDPELGVEVATEDYFTITDSGEHTFDFSDDRGFTLVVPDGALPPPITSYTIEVKSIIPGSSGAFVFPSGYEPISAVYHVSSSVKQFCKPVTFSIEHFALESPTEIASTALVTGSSLNHLPYNFTLVTERHDIQKTIGRVKLECSAPVFLAVVQKPVSIASTGEDRAQPGHMLGLGRAGIAGVAIGLYLPVDLPVHAGVCAGAVGGAVGWSDYAWNLPSYALQLGRRLSGKKRCPNSYCGMLFCQSADPDLSVLYLHFVVVKNLSVYIDVVKKQYHTFHKVLKPETVRFVEGVEKLVINISERGTDTADGLWHVRPGSIPLEIRKEDVDDYTQGTVIPKCQLLLKRKTNGRIPPVQYSLKIQGAEPKAFSIYINPEGAFECKPVPAPAPEEEHTVNIEELSSGVANTNKTTLENALSEVDLCEVHEALWKVRYKWFKIGIGLDLSYSDLENIQSEPGLYRDNDARLTKMIEIWLKRRDPRPTWQALIDVLKSDMLGEEGLAEDIKAKLTRQ